MTQIISPTSPSSRAMLAGAESVDDPLGDAVGDRFGALLAGLLSQPVAPLPPPRPSLADQAAPALAVGDQTPPITPATRAAEPTLPSINPGDPQLPAVSPTPMAAPQPAMPPRATTAALALAAPPAPAIGGLQLQPPPAAAMTSMAPAASTSMAPAAWASMAPAASTPGLAQPVQAASTAMTGEPATAPGQPGAQVVADTGQTLQLAVTNVAPPPSPATAPHPPAAQAAMATALAGAAAAGQPTADHAPAADGQLPATPVDAGEPTLAAAQPAALAVAAERRPATEPRTATLRSTAETALTRAGVAAYGDEASGDATAKPQPAATASQPIAMSPIPGFARLTLAWQAQSVEAEETAFVPGLLGGDGVGGTAERASLAATEASSEATTRPVMQLAQAIDRAVKGELRQLTIQLSPRELGTIEIALELDADRRLAVTVLAERPETLDLLRQDARQLERLLGQQGLDLGDAGLELGLMGGERRHGGEQPRPQTPSLMLSDDPEPPVEPGPLQPPPGTQASQRLNLSI